MKSERPIKKPGPRRSVEEAPSSRSDARIISAARSRSAGLGFKSWFAGSR